MISNELGGAKSLRLFLPMDAAEIGVLGVGGAFKLGVLGRGLTIGRFAGLEHTFNQLTLASHLGSGARLTDGILHTSHTNALDIAGRAQPGLHLPDGASAIDVGRGSGFEFHRLDTISTAGSHDSLASHLDLAGSKPVADLHPAPLGTVPPGSVHGLPTTTHGLTDLTGLHSTRGDLSPNATPSTFSPGGFLLKGDLTDAALSAHRSMQLGQPIDGFVSPEVRAALNGNGVTVLGRTDTSVSLNVDLPAFGSHAKLLEPPAPAGAGHAQPAHQPVTPSSIGTPSVSHLLEPPKGTGAPVQRAEPPATGRSAPPALQTQRSALDLVEPPRTGGGAAAEPELAGAPGKQVDGGGVGSGKAIDDAGHAGTPKAEPDRIALRPEPPRSGRPGGPELHLTPEQATAVSLHQQSVLHLEQARQARADLDAQGGEAGLGNRLKADKNLAVAEAVVRRSEGRLKAAGIDPARLGDDLGEGALDSSRWAQAKVEGEVGALRNLRKPVSQWPAQVKTWFRGEATELHAKLVQDVSRIGPHLDALPGNPVGERIGQFERALDDLRERAAGFDTFHRLDAFRSASGTAVKPGLLQAKTDALLLARTEFADSWAAAAHAPNPSATRSALIRDLDGSLPKLDRALEQAAKDVDALRPPGTGVRGADARWAGLRHHLTVELAATSWSGGPAAGALRDELLQQGGLAAKALDRGAAEVDAGRRIFDDRHGSAFRPGEGGADLTRLREEFASTWSRSRPPSTTGTIAPEDFPEWAAARDGASVGVRSGDWTDPFAGAGGKPFVTHHEFEARRFSAGGEWYTDLTVKVSLTDASKFGAGAEDRVWSAVSAGVEKFLNTAKHGRPYRLPNGDHLHITVQRVPPGSGEHLPVTIVDRDTAPMDQRTWWSDADPAMYSHEVSHQLGLRDESWPGVPNRTDVKGSLTGDFRHAPGSDLKGLTDAEQAEFDALAPGGLRGRHLQLIERHLGDPGPDGGYHGDFGPKPGSAPVPGAPPRAPSQGTEDLGLETAMSDRFGTAIGHRAPGGTPLHPDILARLDRALSDLPEGHLTGNTELQTIKAGGSDSPASHYSATDRAIHITVPKVGRWQVSPSRYAGLDRSSTWQRFVMDRALLESYEGSGIWSDLTSLRNPFKRHVMGGISDRLAHGNLLEWTARHETGHAVDERVEWFTFHAHEERFGGWTVHDGSHELAPIADRLLRRAGVNPFHRQYDLLLRSLTTRIDLPKGGLDARALTELDRTLEQLPALFKWAPRNLHVTLRRDLHAAFGPEGVELDGSLFAFDSGGWLKADTGSEELLTRMGKDHVPDVAIALLRLVGHEDKPWAEALVGRLGELLHPPRLQAAGVASLDGLAKQFPQLPAADLARIKGYVDTATRQPWTFDDGLAGELDVGGRVYQLNHDGKWVSYLAQARDRYAVSNYQFSTPQEFFAEIYATFHDPKPGLPGSLEQSVQNYFTKALPKRLRQVAAGEASRTGWDAPPAPEPRRLSPWSPQRMNDLLAQPERKLAWPHAPAQDAAPVDVSFYGPGREAPSPLLGDQPLRFAGGGPVAGPELAGLRGGAAPATVRGDGLSFDVRRYELPADRIGGDGTGVRTVREFTVQLHLEPGDLVTPQHLADLRARFEAAAELGNRGYLLPGGDELRLRVAFDAPDAAQLRVVGPDVGARSGQIVHSATPEQLFHDLLRPLGVRDDFLDPTLAAFFTGSPDRIGGTAGLHAGDLELSGAHLARIGDATPKVPAVRHPALAPALPPEWAAIRADAPVAQVDTVRFDPQVGSLTTGDRTYIRHDVRRMETADGRWVREYTLKLSLRPDHPQIPAGQHAGAADVEAIKQRLTGVVDAYLNGRHRMPGGDQFHLRLEFDAPDPHAVVAVHTGPEASNQLAWRATDGDGVLLHEVLHYLGLKDEYVDGAMLFRRNEALTIAPGRTETPTALRHELGGDPGVMGRAAHADPQPVLARYVRAIGEQHGLGGGVLHDAPHGADLSWWKARPKPEARPPLELGAVEGPASRVVEWFRRPDVPDPAMTAAVERIDAIVQEAYDLARRDPSIFLDHPNARLRQFAESWRGRLEATDEAGRRAHDDLLPRRFGYAVEELATMRIEAAKAEDPALQQVTVSFQETYGHTRPDIVLRRADEQGTVLAEGWFDLTALNSLGHIEGKSGSGWHTREYVAEILYPSLGRDRAELGTGADEATREALRLLQDRHSEQASRKDWALRELARHLDDGLRAALVRKGGLLAVSEQRAAVRGALEQALGSSLAPKTVKSLLARIGEVERTHLPARHGFDKVANDLATADRLLAGYGQRMPAPGDDVEMAEALGDAGAATPPHVPPSIDDLLGDPSPRPSGPPPAERVVLPSGTYRVGDVAPDGDCFFNSLLDAGLAARFPGADPNAVRIEMRIELVRQLGRGTDAGADADLANVYAWLLAHPANAVVLPAEVRAAQIATPGHWNSGAGELVPQLAADAFGIRIAIATDHPGAGFHVLEPVGRAGEDLPVLYLVRSGDHYRPVLVAEPPGTGARAALDLLMTSGDPK